MKQRLYDLALAALKFFIEHVLRVRWVVVFEDDDSQGEFGVRILGINCTYYKRATPLVWEPPFPKWREVNEKEFGHIIVRRKP